MERIPTHADETAKYYARRFVSALAELSDIPNLLLRPVTTDGSVVYGDLLPADVVAAIMAVDELLDDNNGLHCNVVDMQRAHGIIQ